VVPERSPDPDLQLVESARAGSPSAFEALVRRHAGRVHRQALSILRSQEDARDVSQETFVRAYRHLSTFRGEAKFATWLQRIAANLALMKLRSRRRCPERPIDELLPGFQEDGHHLAAIGTFPESGHLDDGIIRRDLILEAMSQLPENYREILILRSLQELDTKEAAAQLQISTTAVKLRLHRAHQALRTILVEQLDQR
jgi:RNA polymerase sigma-70 factor, ECF subfamily